MDGGDDRVNSLQGVLEGCRVGVGDRDHFDVVLFQLGMCEARKNNNVVLVCRRDGVDNVPSDASSASSDRDCDHGENSYLCREPISSTVSPYMSR